MDFFMVKIVKKNLMLYFLEEKSGIMKLGSCDCIKVILIAIIFIDV